VNRFLWACWLWLIAWALPVSAQTLEDQLRQSPLQDLAAESRMQGDAVRGAVLFFQQHILCSKCHSFDTRQGSLGPDLSLIGPEVSDEMLVESVLWPSKLIRKGFESITVVTLDGRTSAGVLVERTPMKLVLRDAARLGELVTLTAAQLDTVTSNRESLMPAGQINQLASRQQFLDLIRYLMEIRDGGPPRAKELQPPPALLTFTLPEYENHIDHAGFIASWDAESLKRGEAIYRRVCMNCHGTKDQPGSLPTSLRFAEEKFRGGSDPFSIYQTLTRGSGLMAAQTWMVPSQKYDVIHYLRETYLRKHNPTQYTEVDTTYLASLPKGNIRGPEASHIQPWSAMDYGPHLTHTYEVPGGSHNIAYKGIAIRLDPGAGGVSRGRHWILFDSDTLRMSAMWSSSGPSTAEQNFIDWRGIQFNGEHQIHPRIVGQLIAANGTGPGWANPSTRAFGDDQRVQGRDGRRYGPLPSSWAKFRGLYHHGHRVVLSYSVADTSVLESPTLQAVEDSTQSPLFLRTFNIGPRNEDLILQVAQNAEAEHAVAELASVRLSSGESNNTHLRLRASDESSTHVGFAPRNAPLEWKSQGERLLLRISAGQQPLRFTLWTTSVNDQHAIKSDKSQITVPNAEEDLKSLTVGGPARWKEKLTTMASIGSDIGPFAADVLTAPEANPWLAQTRFTGLDFFADGRIAVCSWDGDVWIVESVSNGSRLTWQRIASGLFQPLGLKIVNDKIHVTCRDQLAVLHDLNGDAEIDYYECLNNDHQVTEHFHEFAMGLQTDAAGNFYYAKSARHALPAVVPHHGTLLRVSRDGSRTDILANGFRAANGVCLNPDGSFVVTDQEGHWNPKNRINWVRLDPSGKPKFYGNMFGYHDVTDRSDSAMEQPLCWITNVFDRSPGELLWINSDRWGKLRGSLLNLSYGYGKVFLVPHESVNGQMQGGMIELPVKAFPTGVMRGRFHPRDGQLYLCGMFAWAGSAIHPGGLYRLRATGIPMILPIQLHATSAGLQLKFTEPLDPDSIAAANIHVKTWALKRTAKYGSDHYDERSLTVRDTALSEDGKTLTIFADVKPTWCMEIRYSLKSVTGQRVEGTIHNTIHHLKE
jgi:putative heme-binding domain-containing protein